MPVDKKTGLGIAIGGPEIAGVVVCGAADNVSLTSKGIGLMIFFFITLDLHVSLNNALCI